MGTNRRVTAPDFPMTFQEPGGPVTDASGARLSDT